MRRARKARGSGGSQSSTTGKGGTRFANSTPLQARILRRVAHDGNWREHHEFSAPARQARVPRTCGHRGFGGHHSSTTACQRYSGSGCTGSTVAGRTGLRAFVDADGCATHAAGRLQHPRACASHTSNGSLGLTARSDACANARVRGRFCMRSGANPQARVSANSPTGCGGCSGSKSLQRPCFQRPDARSISTPPAARNASAAWPWVSGETCTATTTPA